MNSDDFERLLGYLTELAKFLEEYNKITGYLAASNAEQVEETDELLGMRKKLVQPMALYNTEIMKLVNRQSGSDRTLIAKMFGGKSIVQRLTDEERRLQEQSLNIVSLKSAIISKDEYINKKITEKRDEIRDRLTELQEDKKKINFYANINNKLTGGAFDSHS